LVTKIDEHHRKSQLLTPICVTECSSSTITA
jgi:hypothetical protein